MNNFIGRYRKRNLGDSSSIKDREVAEMRSEFDDYLKYTLTAQEYIYTKVDELPNLETNSKELMAITDVAKNDKSALDEKYLICRLDTNIDVGCYLYWNNSWNLIIFEEQKSIQGHKKFVMRRCNNILNFVFKGKMYHIPLSISNLTMYSKGISEMKYAGEADSKRNVFVGSNPITRQILIDNRIMLTNMTTFRITHVNDFEYTRRSDGESGLLKWLCVQTTLLNEDDKENNVAYNPISKPDTNGVNKITGDSDISMGEINEYSIEYEGEIEFTLDGTYSSTSLVNIDKNKCEVTQDVDFNVLGESFVLIARDKNTSSTVDMMTVNIKGA